MFAYDGQQTLKKSEKENDVPGKLEAGVVNFKFKLTDKIRTNKAVASFIALLFNKSRVKEKFHYDKIEILNFGSKNNAKLYLENLKPEDWKIVNYTPPQYSEDIFRGIKISKIIDTPHKVIGQEFDNIVAVIDENFHYVNGVLANKYYNYYDQTQMLFQIVSRTRFKLKIVVINNEEILNRCLEIIN